MEIYTSYRVKIKHYNQIFIPTVRIYRHAVKFFLDIILNEWEIISAINGSLNQRTFIERLTIRTKRNPEPIHPFEDADKTFYKMPGYLRRAAIAEALGMTRSYKSNLSNWENEDPAARGKQPGIPSVSCLYPALYRENMFLQTGDYKAQVKVYVHNTWDWITVQLRKSDMDYISRHCSGQKHCVPILRKRGHEWFLDFSFQEHVVLTDIKIQEQTILAVDLGINSAAVVTAMTSDGTILGRHFLKLSKEQDSLMHSVNRIKKAQQHGSYKTPRLWAKAKGINHDISVKTADFIIKTAARYGANAIVFEHLNIHGKKRGSKKQKLQLWRKQEVQAIVTNKAHHFGMRISHVCAWNTSRLAFDGSGSVLRGRNAGLGSYSMCKFTNGKIYNCDLSASYNIGSRYFIREILKSLPEKARLLIEANVPQCSKRSTCTFSTLINLNAALASV